MDHILEARKALVPVVISAVLTLLASFGIVEGMTVGELVTLLSTGALVWLVPNKPQGIR